MSRNDIPEIWAAAAKQRLDKLVLPNPVMDSFIIMDEDMVRTFPELEEKFLKPCVARLARRLDRVGKVEVEIAYHVPTSGVEVTVIVM
jgi:hypothetical protein